MQPVQPEDISGEQVVLNDAPVDGPERGNDRVVAAVDQSLPLRGFPAEQVGGAFGLDDILRDAKSDLTVDASVAAGLLRVVVLDDDLVSEEPRGPGAGMSDQCFVLGQFQFEFVTQELGQALLDLLASDFGPAKPRR